MATTISSFAKALPKPKYTGEEEALPLHTQTKGLKVVGAGALDDTQVVLKVGSKTSASHNETLKFDNSEVDLHPMVTEQDGDPVRRRTMAMEVPFQKYLLHSTRLTWAESLAVAPMR